MTRHRPRILSVGLPFVFAELTSRAVLSRAKPSLADFEKAEAAFPLAGASFSLFLYVPEGGSVEQCYTRMFAPLDNILEDPATGSASAALAGYLVSLMPQRTLETTLTFEQGIDMGRPSLLKLDVQKTEGIVERVTVGGSCVTVMKGELSL
jgi:trans-2,3-dihydro-3-hydroxyanthranilate isomerase